jgi:prepilin-type processing-associated H-X9-DG protein
MLMPYFEEESLYNLYNRKVAWFYQLAEVAETVIPFMVCPSNTGENPIFDKQLNNLLLLAVGQPPTLYYTSEQRLGATTYSFCKGATDSWCFGTQGTTQFLPPGPPFVDNAGERGIFDMNWSMPIRRITDGTSKTIAMGEGAGGVAWPVAKARAAMGLISTHEPNESSRLTPYGPDGTGLIRNAQMAWIIGEPSFNPLDMLGDVVGAICMAQTLDPINKNPVSQAFADVANLGNCARSMPGADGSPQTGTTCRRLPSGSIKTNTCAKHVACNFRSDHPGGANFLFADGSVHFLSEDVNMLTYQRLSTMAGSEIVEVPED